MKSFFQYAIDRSSLFRSIKVALVVGTINALITQYDAVCHQAFTLTNFFQIMLTYLVPFGVAIFSSVMQAKHDERAGISEQNQ